MFYCIVAFMIIVAIITTTTIIIVVVVLILVVLFGVIVIVIIINICMLQVRPNLSLGDTLAGLHGAFGAVMALLHRQRNAGVSWEQERLLGGRRGGRT